jgi:hypothetical protein
MHPPLFRKTHRLSDWRECVIELHCSHCRGGLVGYPRGINSDGSLSGVLEIDVNHGNFFEAISTAFVAGNEEVPGSGNSGSTVAFTNVAPPPAVPEASTWAVMLIGFAGLGYAGCRASRKSAALAA